MSEGTLHIQFRAGALAPAIASRQSNGTPSAGEVSRRNLERYEAIIADELLRLRLTANEAMLILDVLNGTLLDPPSTARLLWAEVADTCLHDHLHEKWDVSGEALVERVRGLSLAGNLALIDAAERYWAAVGRGESPTPADVGL